MEAETILYHLSIGSITVDEEGRVWKHGRLSSGVVIPYEESRRIDRPNQLGYHAVKLTTKTGKRISTSAHRIQWVKNHGAVPDGLEINHKDVDKSNNRLGNLELITHSGNLKHAYKLKSWVPDCPDHPKAKLTWEKVRYIRAEVGSGRSTQKAMADKFGVSGVSISHIICGKNWPLRRDPLHNMAS